MSKKKFIDGLESLFSEATQEDLKESTLISPKKEQSVEDHSSSGKSFASDLQSLFSEAFEETIEEKLIERKETPRPRQKPKRKFSGLDMLIRSTVESSEIEVQSTPTKRVSLIIEQEKLMKLKKIAKMKKAYLKDIIDEIVSDYLDTFEQRSK